MFYLCVCVCMYVVGESDIGTEELYPHLLGHFAVKTDLVLSAIYW